MTEPLVLAGTDGIARYNRNRWFASAKLILGEKGFDFENGDPISYGGDIYRPYDQRNDPPGRGPNDYGNEVGQGNTTDIFIGDLQAGYVINPVTNLKVFGGFTFRNFTPTESGNFVRDDNTTWFTVGLRADVFNWYFDF